MSSVTQQTITEDLSELFEGGRHAREIETLAATAGTLARAVPRPLPGNAESMAARRDSLLALHAELYGPGAGTVEETPTRAPREKNWRVFVPVAIGAALALLLGLAIFVDLVFMKPAEPTVASLRVQAGTVAVVSSSGERKKVRDETDLREGDRVVSGSRSLSEVRFANGTVARLDESTEVELAFAGERVTEITLQNGRVYSQVEDGDVLEVASRWTSFTGVGNATDVSVVDEGAQVIAVRGPALGHVEAPVMKRTRGEGVVAEQGIVATSGVFGGRLGFETRPVRRDELLTSWFAYNLAMDRNEGLDPGILGDLPPEEMQEITPPVIPPPEEEPVDETQSSATEPGPEPEPVITVPQPDTKPAPPPPSASLEAAPFEGGIELGWTASGLDSIGAISVLRAEGGRAPSFPADSIANLEPSARGFTDNEAAPGGTYTYRLALLTQGSVTAYSNSATATVPVPPQPKPSLTLSGSAAQSGASLYWSLENLPGVTEWAVCRSTTNPNPSYPDDDFWILDYTGDSGSFFDDTAKVDVTYFYRVAAKINGEPVLYSNSISLTIPRIL